MEIKRNNDAIPNWGPFEYAILSQNELFSNERWKKTVKWNLLLEQAGQINHAINMLTKAPYPTRLFCRYIDILEANLYIFDDMFYYLTGRPLTDGISDDIKKTHKLDETWERLQFWNIDSHDIIMKIAESLSDSRNTFNNILQRDELSDIKKLLDSYCEPALEDKNAKYSPEEESVFRYIKELYVEKEDISTLVHQIDNILIIMEQDSDFMFQWAHGWFSDCFLLDDFDSLLDKFVRSERGKMIVQGWEHELNQTREKIIESLEREEKYRPWVYKYCHLADKHNIIHELFGNEESTIEIDEDKLNNTDNWISILSIAAILQEHNKRQEIINQLKPFFYNEENNVRDFYERIKNSKPQMVTKIVKQFNNVGKLSDKSKMLYNILYKNGLYSLTYQNWHNQTL